jgi:hypothetical protein
MRSARARRRPFEVTPLDDEYQGPATSRDLAVVRYDGDPDVFAALASDWLRREGRDETIEPPRPRLYRWNVDPTRYYDLVLAEAAERGPGVWIGAKIEYARKPETGPIAERYCQVCDARPGEHHWDRCAMGRRLAGMVTASSASDGAS